MPQDKEKASYRSIMKATSIFGGVQVFQIVVRIIRSKLVAVLLGPTGMGIVGLFTSTIDLITSLTNFGLGTSAVKNIAEATATGNNNRIATVVTVLRRWVWITGFLGALICLSLSKWLSRLTFGNEQYTIAFVWLSITLLFTQLSSGQLVLLQGMRKIKELAKANLWGSLAGLIVTAPIYYFFGEKGIVPVIIITAFAALLLSWYFSSKIQIGKTYVSKLRILIEGRSMLQMGFLISLSGLLTLIVSYITRIFISRQGGVADVGFYNAGFAILTTYVGMIFTAMGTDYYPRLSVIAHNTQQCNQTINQQAEIALLILGPVLVAFFVFMKLVIVLLYSQRFIPIISMISWAALGMYFRAASWSIAFLFLAKGASRLFFWNEFLTNIYVLLLNIAGYYWSGLTGLGVSFLVVYVIYLLQVYFVSKVKYGFEFTPAFWVIFCVQIVIGMSCFIVVSYCQPLWSYIIGCILLIISSWFSIKQLDKRMGLKSILSKLITRK